MTHLLVTNDFPPKVGGIQSYLWELWRRLPPETTTVLTTPYEGDRAFDDAAAAHALRIERTRRRVLLPTPALVRRVGHLAADAGAELVVLGNVGDGAEPAVADALRRALADRDPLIRSHAVWAAARLGRQDLLDALGDDQDVEVRAELGRARAGA